MTTDLLSVLNRVARSVESVVPGLELQAQIGDPVWLEDDPLERNTAVGISALTGELVSALGFRIRYQGVWLGRFENASNGSERDRVQAVALELLSQVQDAVAIAATDPWPLVVVDNRQDMPLPDVRISGDELHMWFGDAGAPALKLPSVSLL